MTLGYFFVWLAYGRHAIDFDPVNTWATWLLAVVAVDLLAAEKPHHR